MACAEFVRQTGNPISDCVRCGEPLSNHALFYTVYTEPNAWSMPPSGRGISRLTGRPEPPLNQRGVSVLADQLTTVAIGFIESVLGRSIVSHAASPRMVTMLHDSFERILVDTIRRYEAYVWETLQRQYLGSLQQWQYVPPPTGAGQIRPQSSPAPEPEKKRLERVIVFPKEEK